MAGRLDAACHRQCRRVHTYLPKALDAVFSVTANANAKRALTSPHKCTPNKTEFIGHTKQLLQSIKRRAVVDHELIAAAHFRCPQFTSKYPLSDVEIN